jgi:predicted DNA-binding transcriptional regulator AlpA
LTASGLLDALENRQKQAAKPPGKMLTLKEFGALVNLSQPTLFRMMKRKDESGNPELPTVMLGQRSRRISAEVAESFLRGTRGVL